MNIQNKMRFSVLVVLILAAFSFSFAQSNNTVREVPFIGPEPQPIQQPTVRVQPDQQQPITIINNWPEWQRPAEPRPRVIYLPSKPRVITPPAPVKKDTDISKELPPPPPQMFSQKELICIGGFMFLLIAGIIGYLIAGRRNYYGCNGNCNGCRVSCGGGRDWNMNHQGHIDHVHTGTPTKITHIHTHSGIPAEIILKAEMPPKIEEVPPITNSDTKPIGQQ
jgi:hypothetical protein